DAQTGTAVPPRVDPVTRLPLAAASPPSAYSEKQAAHVRALAAKLVPKTRRSKESVQAGRAVLADSRASVGFRPALKEMLYPIVTERCHGAYIWDPDGNRYIDFMMGFGANLFGHWPEFITQAVHKELDGGAGVGMRSPLAVQAAELLCRITGHERATFA